MRTPADCTVRLSFVIIPCNTELDKLFLDSNFNVLLIYKCLLSCMLPEMERGWHVWLFSTQRMVINSLTTYAMSLWHSMFTCKLMTHSLCDANLNTQIRKRFVLALTCAEKRRTIFFCRVHSYSFLLALAFTLLVFSNGIMLHIAINSNSYFMDSKRCILERLCFCISSHLMQHKTVTKGMRLPLLLSLGHHLGSTPVHFLCDGSSLG